LENQIRPGQIPKTGSKKKPKALRNPFPDPVGNCGKEFDQIRIKRINRIQKQKPDPEPGKCNKKKGEKPQTTKGPEARTLC
jgi:hypothetical protein